MNDTTTATSPAMPTAFPVPGSFPVSQRITLLCGTPDAVIHYTVDGFDPTAESPAFDAFQPVVLEAVNDGDRGVKTHYTIKARAIAAGGEASAVATLPYVIDRRSKDVYLAEELHPGIFQIRDFDDTKMMLVVGSKRALLLDAGLGNGDLRAFVEARIGGLPLDLVISHGHPDHIAAMGQFQGNRYDVYLNHRDAPMVEHFSASMNLGIDLARTIDLTEGMVFDLGDRRLEVFEVPGHSPGHVVLFDAENGLLFASDAIGSNRASIPDSLWMQFPGMSPIDEYLSALLVFRSKVSGIKETYGGHNDAVIYGETYLDNLQQAAQALVDRGPDILVPSLRPTDAWQSVVGDRLTDPNWAAINVNKETCLSVPYRQIDTLANLQLGAGQLTPGFRPLTTSYTVEVAASTVGLDIIPTTTSSRCAALRVNGAPVRSGERLGVELAVGSTPIDILVTAPDGETIRSYTVMVTRG